MTEQTTATVVGPSEDVITFEGRPYRIAERYALMPLLQFAHIARAGATTDDMEALAVVYNVLRAAVHPDDWDAFCEHATDAGASMEDLMPVVTEAVQAMTARPTVRPSDSSDGPTTTEQSSSDGSSSPEPSPREVQRLDWARQLRSVAEVGEEIRTANAGSG
jgi:hypothetical protein